MCSAPAPGKTVALVTLGCVRNEVDSEELAGRLSAAGWTLVDDAAGADVAVVNTCGFVEQAKKDSIDALLEASALKDSSDAHVRTKAVVAVGCLAERYGKDLAAELPEADAVLGFDSYASLSEHLGSILKGDRPAAHTPHDRRTLLPISPVNRQAAAQNVAVPGHQDPSADQAADSTGTAPASGPQIMRRRLDNAPWAPLKLASGCDRRCSFCAIPSFRGAYLSRRPTDVLAEARWLADQGVKEIFLASENSTSYGKDLGDPRLLETLLPQLADIPGLDLIRVSYLQPAEVRPSLLSVMAEHPGVANYWDLSFQHAHPDTLRRMRRFGSTDDFLALIENVRERTPQSGIRSNVIVGFPGETDDEFETLLGFLTRARLDVVGVFAYSDEDGTEAASLPNKVPADVIAERTAIAIDLVEQLTAQRAEERIGEHVRVLVEGHEDGEPYGRAEHQGPDVDGTCTILGEAEIGTWVRGTVTDTNGVDLMVTPFSAGSVLGTDESLEKL